MSKVVDYMGQILAEAAPGGESMVAYATIDLAALRACRRKTGLSNVLSRQPLQAYSESYRQTVIPSGQPAAGWRYVPGCRSGGNLPSGSGRISSGWRTSASSSLRPTAVRL